ncbi:MAG: transglutaminase domain-containing protein, partial [Chthoniobacteraceae bacterium]
ERRTGQLSGAAIRQRISLQPHGGRWIFALDRPTGDQPKFELMPGGYLLNPRLIFNPLHYEVVSRPDNRELTLPIEQMRAALAPAVRGQPSAQVLALVQSWKRGDASGREIVERALHHFHEEKFSYSLNPGTYGENALDDFLFTRRVGFCEHYAAAFASLMRVAGLPSRVVIGYHGGELNRMGNYVIVRQSDAHAWTEVWLQDSGWLRVDPTEVIAPDRISSGLASFLQTRGAGAELDGRSESDTAIGWRDLLRELRLGWDGINYQWELRVLNFDEEDQRTLLTQLGLENRWTEVAGWSAGTVLLLLGAISLWLRRPARSRREAASGAWSDFCRTLAAAGVTRERWEGPLHFGKRAAAVLAEHSTAIMNVADLYARFRYSPAPPSARELIAAVRALPDLRARMTDGK